MNILFSPFIYMFFLIARTLIVISSSSIFRIWLGLELNILSFIPIIGFSNETKKAREASIKYFLIQSIASSIILFSRIWFLLYGRSSLIIILTRLINLSLSVKLGLAPFHGWFPEVIEGLSWVNCLIMMTWQKISPIVALSLFFNYEIVVSLALISALTGAILGLNQASTRKILAFSSISHIGWIMSIISMNSSLWINYLLIYFSVSFITCVSFWYFDLNFLSQLFFLEDLPVKILVFINLLSTGGIPPLLGFLAKIYGFMVVSHSYPILIVLIFRSLITLFFYTRVCLSCFTISQNRSLVWDLSLKKSKIILNSVFLIISSFRLLPVCIFIF